MLIIKVMGGLGNQLQQYALYEKMKSLGKDVRLDVSWFATQDQVMARRELELTYFPYADYKAAAPEEVKALLGGDGLLDKVWKKLYNKRVKVFAESDMYHPEIFDLEDCYLSGYWACEAYYHDCMPLLWQKLRFPKRGSPENAGLAERMSREESVSIHIRRGDYLDKANAEMFGGICTERYYEAAVSKMREALSRPRFYVFSDDPAYARKQYQGPEFVHVDCNRGRDSFYDMYLMSRCRHNICANSTFSFWGARLNQNPDKIVFRPLKHKNSQHPSFARMKELWQGYRILDENGREE